MRVIFSTGKVPFSDQWRQGVLDIQDWSDFDLELVSVRAKHPKGTILALGHPSPGVKSRLRADTGKGPLIATAGEILEIDEPFWSRDTGTKGLSFDIFFQVPGARQGGGQVMKLELLYRQPTQRLSRKLLDVEIP